MLSIILPTIYRGNNSWIFYLEIGDVRRGAIYFKKYDDAKYAKTIVFARREHFKTYIDGKIFPKGKDQILY